MATTKLITTMNTILVFKNGDLFKQFRYKNKSQAKGNYKLFIKYGYIDAMTGEKMDNLTFELL